MLTEHLLLMLAGPPLLLAGCLDCACHRRLRIERSSGLHESLLHLLMLAEVGGGLLLVMCFEVTAATLALLLLACLAHELTVAWDLAWAESRRDVPWFEQWVHGLQQGLPWALLVGLLVLHPAQAASLVGLGDARPDWGIRWKEAPLPPAYVTAFVLAALLTTVLPFASETARCWRARRG